MTTFQSELERRFKLQKEYLGDNKPVNQIQPLVSVSCATYQHGPYIRQCIEGFLMQKTSFPIEIIIGEDGSSDETVEICKEYAEKYPDLIRLFLRDRSLSQYYDDEGKFGGRFNGIWCRMSARGKYIALCEGDDYWIDPLKLQKQVDYMESHPKCSLCFHAHQELFQDGSKVDVHRYSSDVDDCPIKDVIMNGGGFMATNSMLYRRNSLVTPPPKWYFDCPVGDLPLMLLLASSGSVGYIDELWSCYRRDSVGSWSQKMAISFYKQDIHHKKIRQMWKSFDEFTNNRWHSYIEKKIKINNYNHYKSLVLYIRSLLSRLTFFRTV